jgi:large subunit ribosomal protein L29
MKASEIKDMNPDEMQSKISDLREELFNLRFQHEIGQLENPQRMKQTKRDIARLETIFKEVTQNQKEDSE